MWKIRVFTIFVLLNVLQGVNDLVVSVEFCFNQHAGVLPTQEQHDNCHAKDSPRSVRRRDSVWACHFRMVQDMSREGFKDTGIKKNMEIGTIRL